MVRLAAAAVRGPGAGPAGGQRAGTLWQGLEATSDRQPFFAALSLFVLSFAGLCANFYPYIVPSSVTVWEAAAPDNSLSILLVGSVVLLPLILGYTAYSYWVFRGKVGAAGGYR